MTGQNISSEFFLLVQVRNREREEKPIFFIVFVRINTYYLMRTISPCAIIRHNPGKVARAFPIALHTPPSVSLLSFPILSLTYYITIPIFL